MELNTIGKEPYELEGNESIRKAFKDSSDYNGIRTHNHLVRTRTLYQGQFG